MDTSDITVIDIPIFIIWIILYLTLINMYLSFNVFLIYNLTIISHLWIRFSLPLTENDNQPL